MASAFRRKSGVRCILRLKAEATSGSQHARDHGKHEPVLNLVRQAEAHEYVVEDEGDSDELVAFELNAGTRIGGRFGKAATESLGEERRL